MQKWNTLGLCVLLLAMLTACGQEKNMEQATQKDSPAADTEADAGEVSGTTYDDLIRRYRELAADPDAFRDADGAGEQNFLMLAREIGSEWGEDPANLMGYAIRDFNGDGVPELAIGYTSEYGAYLSGLFTLADGTPRLVFGEVGDGYTCLQDGSFFYDGCRSASENGKGIYQLTDDGTALSCRKFYVLRMLDGDEATATVYYNTTGSWEIEDSRETNMTVDEFWSWVPEHADLPLTPFITADGQ